MKIDFNEILRKLEGKANAISINDEKLKELLKAVTKKVKENKDLMEIWDDIKLLTELIRDWKRGEYKNLSKNNVILIIIGLIYLVNPFDIIPDFLFGGFLDDLAVIAFVIKKVSEELEAYKKWRGIRMEEEKEETTEEAKPIEVIVDEEQDDNIIIISNMDDED